MSTSKKRSGRSPSASSFAFERATKRQKISNSSLHGRARWETPSSISSLNSSISTQEAQERKQRLQQFYAITNLASSNDQSETRRKQTVFEANNNKQRNDVEIKVSLQKYMKKVDASKSKIQRELDSRLRKKKLERLKAKKAKLNSKASNSNVDSLDAFMNKLTDSNTNSAENGNKTKKVSRKRGERIFSDESKFDEGDLLIEDDFSYKDLDSKNKKVIKEVDHSSIIYAEIKKNLYVESPEISLLSWSDIEIIRKDMLNNCKVVVSHKRFDLKPILKWTQCGLNNTALKCLAKFKYEKPFAVQSQAIPIIMSGRDLICVAQTGSGKTLAYILPMIRHILSVRTRERDHICGIILCPTRELAQQIFSECHKFVRVLGISVVSVYGGVSISEQIGKLRKGCDVIIGTPGRLIELLCINGGRLLDIKYVSYMVLDEADRLFDLGFHSQITSIIQNVRPDKQLLMFSATFPKKIEKIAREYFIEQQISDETDTEKEKKGKKSKAKKLSSAIQMSVGSSISAPSVNVAQFVSIVDNAEEKFKALLRLLSEWYGRGNILIFVNKRENVDLLFSQLCDSGYFALILHGGINQIDRDYTMVDFKNKVRSILICTSVGSRGLDVTDLKVVINYFPPHHYEDYVHKIGRTGRANTRGVAYTFINRDNLENELKCVPHIMKAMKKSSYFNQISAELTELQSQYYNDLNNGEIKCFKNKGYAGKGHKFDKSEENLRKNNIERQKYVYGAKDELHEWNLNKTSDVTDITNNKNGNVTVSESEVNDLKNIKKDSLPLSRDLSMLKKALLAAKKKKKEIEKRKRKNDKKDIKYEMDTDDLVQKAMNRTIAKEKKKHERQTRDRVETIAKIISMEIESNESKQSIGNEGNGDSNTKVHIFKLDINEYPPNARKQIGYKPTLNPIKENYNVRITQKGTFIQSGRKVPKGESSLYLEIQGTNITDIRGAIKELKQILHTSSAHRGYAKNTYAKYKVV